jgi:hypothetical protein
VSVEARNVQRPGQCPGNHCHASRLQYGGVPQCWNRMWRPCWSTCLPVVRLSVFEEDQGNHCYYLVPVTTTEGLWGSHRRFQPKGCWRTIVGDGKIQSSDHTCSLWMLSIPALVKHHSSMHRTFAADVRSSADCWQNAHHVALTLAQADCGRDTTLVLVTYGA